jgi:type 1 glutamine amidotransferase
MVVGEKMTKRIVFHIGGPAFHPVDRQAKSIVAWLGAEHECELHDGVDAFDHLEKADLLVLMGLHWTGMGDGLTYRPMNASHVAALERYVVAGKPIIAHHGAIASYDDCPRFAELVGFAWIWGKTNHSPIGEYTVRVLPTSHPIVAGLSDYSIHDELYYDIALTRGMKATTHAEAEFQGKRLPMIMTAERPNKIAYLANGHDMKAFECPAMKTLWLNAVRWALQA